MGVFCSEDITKLSLPEMMNVLSSRVRDAILRREEAHSRAYREKLKEVLLQVYARLGLLRAEIEADLDINPRVN